MGSSMSLGMCFHDFFVVSQEKNVKSLNVIEKLKVSPSASFDLVVLQIMLQA